MTSTKILKRDLLESQNLKLKEECSVLKERYLLVRRKLSQNNFNLTPTNQELKSLNQRIQIYQTEFSQLSKTVIHRKSQSSSLQIEKTIENQQVHLKNLQKENQKLTKIINSDLKIREPASDLQKEQMSLKSLISKLEQNSLETQKLIEAKRSQYSELSQKFQHLQTLAPATKKIQIRFTTKEKAEDYLKSLQKSYTNCITKYAKIINNLEAELYELKDQETILQSTYIKKKQQHRLILTMGESDIKENSKEDRQILDVKFYYKPTIKYLYI